MNEAEHEYFHVALDGHIFNKRVYGEISVSEARKKYLKQSLLTRKSHLNLGCFEIIGIYDNEFLLLYRAFSGAASAQRRKSSTIIPVLKTTTCPFCDPIR